MKATSEIRLIINQNVRQTEYKIFLKTFYAKGNRKGSKGTKERAQLTTFEKK